MRFFCVPVLVALLCASQVQAGVSDGVFAKVNEQVILKSELERTKTALNERYSAQGQKVSAERLQAEAFELLLLRKLQLGIIQRAGVSINETAVTEQLTAIAKEQGFTTLQAFKDSLETANKGSYDTLRQELIDEMALGVLQEHELGNRVNISDQDINAFLRTPEGQALDQNEYRTWHLRVPYIDDKARTEQAAAQVQQALMTNQSLEAALAVAYPKQIQGVDSGYHLPQGLPKALAPIITRLGVGEVVAFAGAEGIDVIKLVDKRQAKVLMPKWQASHILIKADNKDADKQIAEIYNALAKGADFASLARTYSQDTVSALSGGSLGWVEEGQMVPAFERVMKQTQKGQISTPFTTQFGYHILKINDLQQQDVTEQYRRATARQVLFEKNAPKAQEDWLQELKQNAYIHILN